VRHRGKQEMPIRIVLGDLLDLSTNVRVIVKRFLKKQIVRLRTLNEEIRDILNWKHLVTMIFRVPGQQRPCRRAE
jgi:hypothetical protein